MEVVESQYLYYRYFDNNGVKDRSEFIEWNSLRNRHWILIWFFRFIFLILEMYMNKDQK